MIHITQCLCGPQRHAILAITWADPEFTSGDAEAHLKIFVESLIETNTINPWCGICGSRNFRYEDGVTRYRTMKEATPDLQLAQLSNLLSGLSLKPERQ